MGLERKGYRQTFSTASELESIFKLNARDIDLVGSTSPEFLLLWANRLYLSTSFEEAQSSVSQLATSVQQVLERNDELSRRLDTLEIHPDKRKNLILSESQNADESSAETVLRNTPLLASFEQDLYASPVYARTTEGKSSLSIPLSTTPSNTRSSLSSLSLADVSDISLLSLPITTAEIWNHHHYPTEHHEMTKTHAPSRESHCAISQGSFVLQAKAEVKMPLDKILDAGMNIDKSSSCVPNKIMLLGTLILCLSASSPTRIMSAKCNTCAGISLAGKTTVLKQLQNLYAGGFTAADRVEARAAILSSLLSAFQGAWNRIRYMEDDFEDDAERLLNARALPNSPGLKGER